MGLDCVAARVRIWNTWIGDFRFQLLESRERELRVESRRRPDRERIRLWEEWIRVTVTRINGLTSQIFINIRFFWSVLINVNVIKIRSDTWIKFQFCTRSEPKTEIIKLIDSVQFGLAVRIGFSGKLLTPTLEKWFTLDERKCWNSVLILIVCYFLSLKLISNFSIPLSQYIYSILAYFGASSLSNHYQALETNKCQKYRLGFFTVYYVFILSLRSQLHFWILFRSARPKL